MSTAEISRLERQLEHCTRKEILQSHWIKQLQLKIIRIERFGIILFINRIQNVRK